VLGLAGSYFTHPDELKGEGKGGIRQHTAKCVAHSRRGAIPRRKIRKERHSRAACSHPHQPTVLPPLEKYPKGAGNMERGIPKRRKENVDHVERKSSEGRDCLCGGKKKGCCHPRTTRKKLRRDQIIVSQWGGLAGTRGRAQLGEGDGKRKTSPPDGGRRRAERGDMYGAPLRRKITPLKRRQHFSKKNKWYHFPEEDVWFAKKLKKTRGVLRPVEGRNRRTLPSTQGGNGRFQGSMILGERGKDTARAVRRARKKRGLPKGRGESSSFSAV